MNDEQLQHLIHEVRQYPQGSWERKISMNHLLRELQRLPGLRTCFHPNHPEALNRTWIWVSRNIKRFEPRPPSVQQSLLYWVNGQLYWRCKDCCRSPKPSNIHSLNEPLGGNESGLTLMDILPDPSPAGLERLIEELQQQKIQRIGCSVEQAIEQDPHRKLRTLHPQGRPECNCHWLSQNLLLKDPPNKLAQLARNLNINYQTLRSHWINKCLPCLRTIALEQGYHPGENYE